MENKELLEAIGKMIDTKLEPIQSDMQDMKSDMQDMKSEMQDIRTDVNNIQYDISAMKEDISEIKEHAEITRYNTNVIGAWAEKASKEIEIPLIDKAQ